MRRIAPIIATMASLLAAAPAAATSWALENEALWPGGPSPYGVADADIDAREAWATTRGGGVVVAVVDTGVDASHPDLAGRLVPGWDFVQGDPVPHDGNGHGTHVAGLVLAVAPEARVMPLRVLDRGGDGTSRDLARAIRWATARGAHVVNLSVGHFERSAAVARAVAAAQARGVLVLAAAGNHGEDLRRRPLWPASHAGVLAVTCSDASDVPCAGAARGAALAAPGASLPGPRRGGGHEVRTGSSQATAIASGVAALARAAAPAASAAALRAALLGGADRPAGLGGAPRLNAAGAVALSAAGRTS